MPKTSQYADFVGRKAELGALNDWIATPAGEMLVVTANAGTGKSYLLGKLADDLGKETNRFVFTPGLAGDPAPVHLGYLALGIAKGVHPLLDSDARAALRDIGMGFAEKVVPGAKAASERTVEARLDKMEASDYPRLLTRVLREASGAMGKDDRIVCILDAEKHFADKTFHQALHAVACGLPEKVKFVLGVRPADPVLESDLREAACVLCDRAADPGDPLALFWPLGDMSAEEAEKLTRDRLGERATPEVLAAIHDRCGQLALAVDAGIKMVEMLGPEALVTLQGLPPGNASRAARNCMTTLADHALKAPAPGPDLAKLLALAREPLCRSDLAEALKHVGRDCASGDLVKPLATLAVGNCVRRVVVDDAECYEPYHDWMREALREGASGDPSELALCERALGRMYASWLTAGPASWRAVRHSSYHLRRGPLVDAGDRRELVTVVAGVHELKMRWGFAHETRDELEVAVAISSEGLEEHALALRAAIRNGLGLARMHLGELPAALDDFRAAEGLAEELGAGGLETAHAALANAGIAHSLRGDVAAALECFQRARLNAVLRGNRSDEATALLNIGNITMDLDGPREALKHYQHASDVIGHAGAPDLHALVAGAIGVAYAQTGELEKALPLLEEARDVAVRLGHMDLLARALGNMGTVRQSQGRFGEALRLYQKSSDIARSLGNPELQARNDVNMGLIHIREGRMADGLHSLRTALSTADRYGIHIESLASMRELVEILDRQGPRIVFPMDTKQLGENDQ